MKLSIVIICWNDRAVILECLRSIFSATRSTEFEVIVSDNGSTDGSRDAIRERFPQVRICENGANLRFAKGNNAGIKLARGEYVLILNPDTIIHEGALDSWVRFADQHPEAGAFGCRVYGADGSYQESARPFPTVWRDLLAALCLRPLAMISKRFVSDRYWGWNGDSEREVDWQCGCCLLVRGGVLKRLGGFDEQFFYYYEEVDLCRRIWNSGRSILFVPSVSITHLGGQSTRRFPIAFELDKQITRYRYYYKYFGVRGARRCRLVSLTWYGVRMLLHGFLQSMRPNEARARRLELCRAAFDWNRRVDVERLFERGEEPRLSAALGTRIPQV
ncbi:MAG TPA: glycosyltransferase family 2 protein [Candidatus Acidoferrum sp.]|nr:glycosyltransferase family 2 protein [Candidatus Acidoferrum sp.]